MSPADPAIGGQASPAPFAIIARTSRIAFSGPVVSATAIAASARLHRAGLRHGFQKEGRRATAR
ncbi:hypothetical protein, partial [Sphingomonas bacterium]|uniref:hypothetical protein n=1 Tax=Sphingomonas bacterium TaxID=1895847 RepID=UPI0020C63390